MRIRKSGIFPDFKIWRRSRKLTFSYEGSKFRLVSNRRVRMAPPQSDAIADYQNQAGFWITVSDRMGHVLFRRVMRNPVSRGREVFTNRPDEQLFNVTDSQPRGTFVVVVPDIPLGVDVSLVDSRPTDAPQGRRVAEVSHFPLREDRTKGDGHERQ